MDKLQEICERIQDCLFSSRWVIDKQDEDQIKAWRRQKLKIDEDVRGLTAEERKALDQLWCDEYNTKVMKGLKDAVNDRQEEQEES